MSLPQDFNLQAELSETGKKQAIQMGKEMAQKGYRFTAVYCSPVGRTQETYDFLKNGWSEVTQDVLPAFQISSGLKERHGGQLENVSKQVYEPSKEQEKAEISRFTKFEQFFTYKMPGGCEGYESLHDVFTRFVPCLNTAL